MLTGDFISLVQLGLPVKVVVYDNGVPGFVVMEMRAAGFLDTGTDLKNPDFAAMANAMGIKGFNPGDANRVPSARPTSESGAQPHRAAQKDNH